MPTLHVALYHPEIPPNTGNIGRLCVAVAARLHVIHPIGFSMGAKAVRRAGLDYWRHVDLQEHANADDFWRWCGDRRVHLFSAHAARSYVDCAYEPEDVLVFGCETAGLPAEVITEHGAHSIPMVEGPVRSLNLANAVSVVVYEALRQSRPQMFG